GAIGGVRVDAPDHGRDPALPVVRGGLVDRLVAGADPLLDALDAALARALAFGRPGRVGRDPGVDVDVDGAQRSDVDARLPGHLQLASVKRDTTSASTDSARARTSSAVKMASGCGVVTYR